MIDERMLRVGPEIRFDSRNADEIIVPAAEIDARLFTGMSSATADRVVEARALMESG